MTRIQAVMAEWPLTPWGSDHPPTQALTASWDGPFFVVMRRLVRQKGPHPFHRKRSKRMAGK